MDKLLTAGQAAAQLGVTERQVRNLCRDGRLPARKVGWVWMIREKDLSKAETRPGKGRGRKKVSE
jgi:excisionase family DNA binding protein